MSRRPVDLAAASTAVRDLLRALGEDPEREGLLDTPMRVAKAWDEILSGRLLDPAAVLKTSSGADGFDEVGGYDQMIVVSSIPFASVCEHHMLPFIGHADVGYLPGASGRVVGLSKIPRLVDAFARRLQVQERMTQQVADALLTHLGAQGVGVRITSEHLCASCRGVKKQSRMVTEALLGNFREHAVREEFWHLSDRGRTA